MRQRSGNTSFARLCPLNSSYKHEQRMVRSIGASVMAVISAHTSHKAGQGKNRKMGSRSLRR